MIKSRMRMECGTNAAEERVMFNKQRNNNENTILSWIITVIMLGVAWPIGLFMLFFVLIYSILPNRRQLIWQQLPGAAFTTAGWLIFSYVYSLYIDHVADFSYVYGSLTAIILLMLWLYICMNIVLLGAELNRILSEKRAARRRKDAEVPAQETTSSGD